MGLSTFEGTPQTMKVPHFRNLYQKVGMFGFAGDPFSADMGPQIRGFGFSNDGAIDTLDQFFKDPVFRFPAPASETRAKVIDFVLAMDSDFAPVVGQQLTWRPGIGPDVEARLALFKQQAAVPACELVVRANIDGASVSGSSCE